MPASTDIERLRSALRAAKSFGPVSDETIATAERALGVSFPKGYRAFLSLFGASLGQGYELAGLFHTVDSDSPPMWRDVVSTTLRRRRVSRGHISSSFIFVSDDGCDDAFYLDTAQRDADSESPVVVLGPGRDCQIVASTFVEFVEDLAHNESRA